ncbi:MAG TPA: hypothetical protein PLV92_23530 [Pirellulaceae bacterium]|nr:hypothetical protein [Pirellulaceae bacterium]
MIAQGRPGPARANPSNPPPGAKKSRVEGDKPGDDDRPGSGTENSADPFLIIVPGDTVRSNTFALGLKKVQFESVAGAVFDAHMKCEPGKAAPPMKLKAPSGAIVADVPTKPGVAESEIRGVELTETGVYTLAVSGVAVDMSNCELTTGVVYPKKLDRTIEFVDGRPVAIALPGMSGRTLIEIRLEAESSADPPVQVELLGELRDPRGTKIEVGESLKVTPDGATLTLSKQKLEQCGTFNLNVFDRKRGSGKLRVRATFENPPLGTKTRTLF